MNPSKNPAAAQGWVKSVDPQSGRVFFANHITRKTQWEEPEGWVEEISSPSLPTEEKDSIDEPLPGNWEVMHDPTTGKPFYVDHEKKITQWTRPKVEKKPERPISYAPANSTTTSSAMQRILQASSSVNYQQPRSYTQEASYYRHSHSGGNEIDFSDSLPSLDFSVKKVADKYRLECPDCGSLFTLSKRRHHCRLCGDVYCAECSAHRVLLPLQGPEFEKPVRICDSCNKDVEQGNFFSMRRYLTPLQLFDPESAEDDEDNGVATSRNVNAALAALTLDLDQMVHNAEGFEEKVTIPPQILVPSITKHLSRGSNTADRAVRALASLLSLGCMVGKNDFAHAVYLHGKRRTFDDILAILERSGSDRKTLFVQEQAAQAMFYLTDPQAISSVMRKHSEISMNDTDEYGTVDSLDIHRTLRSMLDHSSVSMNPNLQRWSAATVRNLVLEDQRRACLAINDVAARLASGEAPSALGYESFLEQLVSTGGVMILCSLIGADDSDTRAHATGALGATLVATRAIDGAMTALAEISGGTYGGGDKKDGDIVRAITAGGGCGSSVSQLLLSADNNVAGMGCEFIASLVLPLLINPLGSATLPAEYDCRNDQEGLGACREAALEIASGSCLPALLSIVRENGRITRPIELRKTAMETLAATATAVGEMGKAWAGGKYEEGMEIKGTPASIVRAVAMLNEEQVIDCALEVLTSSSVQSLGSARDTPAARIREAAGIVLGSLTYCSAEAIMELHSRQVLSPLILASNDPSMTAPSTLRGDTAPRCLGMLEAASSILMFTWQHPSGASSELLDRLIEALDIGVITYLFRVLTSKMDWESRDRSAGGMKARSAACRLLCCLFGIALTDETTIGMRRLMDACDADQSHRSASKGPRNIMEAVLTVLQTSLNHAHRMLVGGVSRGLHYQAALLDLVQASLLAAGSMCGSSIAPGGGEGTMIKGDQFLAMRSDEFESRRREVCKVTCEVVIRGGRSGPALLPTILVGGFGEGSVAASLRLALAIAQNGSKEQHSKLALSGLLVPVSDLLRTALSKGDIYMFSAALALVRFCGPYVAAGTSGGIQSVKDAIRVATNVLTLPVNPDASVQQIETQEALKSECISALESLSKNAALWSAISTDALPSIINYLQRSCDPASAGLSLPETRSAALRAVLEIVQVPSHAVSAAEAGLSESLGHMLKNINNQKGLQKDVDEEMLILTMQVLHALLSKRESRRHCRLLQGGVLRSVCAAVGQSAISKPKVRFDSSTDITFLALEVLHFALSDINALGETHVILQSSEAIAFLDAVVAEPFFIRRLCATLLSKTDMKVKRHDNQDGLDDFQVPDLFGSALSSTKILCAGKQSTDEAAASLLFNISVYACAIESHRSESFWKTTLLKDLHNVDEVDCQRVASTYCALFLRLLAEEYNAFLPTSDSQMNDYKSLTRPLVRYRLLEGLKESLNDLTTVTALGNSEVDEFMLSLIVSFNIPYICLSVWKDPALLELAYEVMKMMVEADPDEVLHLFVESKESLLSLFDLLNLDSATEAFVKIADVRRFLASTLQKLAESGQLAVAVKKYDVRSSAISALASACLSEGEHTQDEDEDLTSSRLASGLMQCLVDLCTTVGNGSGTKAIRLSSVEAESIAHSLGKKICHMVISRFLERARLQQYDIEEDENVLDAPDIAMLCAVTQHESALQVIRSIGGLHALAQVAAEGELSAMLALQRGCKGDPSILLEADTYISIVSLFSSEKEQSLWRSEMATRVRVEASAFKLLADLCNGSAKGGRAIAGAQDFQQCLDRALEIVIGAVSQEISFALPTGNETEDTENASLGSKGESGEDSRSGEGVNQDLMQNGKEQTSIEIENLELVRSSFSFITAMLQVPKVRGALLNQKELISAVKLLASLHNYCDLQLEAVKVISQLAPYSALNGSLSPDLACEILLSALATPYERNRPITMSIHVHAAEGIQFVFASLNDEKKSAILREAVALYANVLRSYTLSKNGVSNNEGTNGGEVAFQMATIMTMAIGATSLEQYFDSQALSSLAATVQWRCDPKTYISQDELCFWDGTNTLCLQILSHLLWRENGRLLHAGVRVNDLKENVVMVARPGKAPRKAIDFPSALMTIIKNGESAAKLAAQRIVRCLNIET